jgi:predicted  nucleic acid-binding Zn-ribbon protein
MARPTHDEIIRQLTSDVTALNMQSEWLREELERLRELPTRVAVLDEKVQKLRDEMNDLRRQLEEARKMRWSLVAPIAGAVVSGLIAALVAYFVARK